MNILSKSQNYNENYGAKIVTLSNPIKHPNADRLQGWIIEGNRVWTDLSRKEGDICVFFPLECAINAHLLSRLNAFEDKTLNTDSNVKGYFNKHGRVRAIKLRGEPSEGFLLKIEEITSILGTIGVIKIGEEFDTWGIYKLCEKYIPKNISSEGRASKKENKRDKKLKRINRLIDGQFAFHKDTAQLRRNIHKIQPNDTISITNKLHGTSFVVGNVLVKRVLNWKEKLLKWLGFSIKDTEYDVIYSSRSVVKNKYAEVEGTQHYYGYDLWADIKDVLQPSIEKGITLYGEAVGYTRSGKMIQKGYDYGYVSPLGVAESAFNALTGEVSSAEYYKEGEHFGIYIYRITQTNSDGKVIELSWNQIKEYCNKYGIKHVPEFYYSTAKNWKSFIPLEEHWHENVLMYLQKEYLEKDCTICKTKVPAEGVVVRIDKLYDFEAYKLKSFRFLEHETKELDKGEVDLETAQALIENE